MSDLAEVNTQNNQSLNSIVAGDGGRTTNSPPDNVKIEVGPEGKVLTSGMDSLVLALDLVWRDDKFFRELSALKERAASNECPMPGFLKGAEGQEWLFSVEPFGKEGFEWLLRSPEYAIKLGKWLRPRSRPSAMIEIRSEALWLNGAVEAVDRILSLLNGAGATVDKAKASRVDVCLDILVPKELWNINLVNQRVTRAYEYASHGRKENFSGFTVGKGDILARLYNKDLEIRLKSKKTWMYDIWQLPQVPEEYRAIRIEFQIRREALVELGIDTIWQFANYPRNLWSYCTQCWLKFQDHPELHHTQQTTLPFWSTVQNGFLGSQPAHPLIRAKMVNVKRVQLAQQFLGQFTSLIAIDSEELEPQVSLEDKTPLLKESAVLIGMDDQKLSERVRRKLAKYVHEIQKFKDAEARRKTLNLPQKSTHVKECSKQILERPRHD